MEIYHVIRFLLQIISSIFIDKNVKTLGALTLYEIVNMVRLIKFNTFAKKQLIR